MVIGIDLLRTYGDAQETALGGAYQFINGSNPGVDFLEYLRNEREAGGWFFHHQQKTDTEENYLFLNPEMPYNARTLIVTQPEYIDGHWYTIVAYSARTTVEELLCN